VYRLRLTLAYDGAAFAGSQIQPGQRTVQGDVERALSALDGQPVRAVFAGRTDTGFTRSGKWHMPMCIASVSRRRGSRV
jgi:tRNA pseudouridine38-40 synthase